VPLHLHRQWHCEQGWMDDSRDSIILERMQGGVYAQRFRQWHGTHIADFIV
jgi:hypothetical protein